MIYCLLCRPPCTLDNTVCVEGGIRLVAFEGRVVWQWMHAGVVGAAALHVAHHFYMYVFYFGGGTRGGEGKCTTTSSNDTQRCVIIFMLHVHVYIVQ